jgi:mRNA interferase MazF
MNPFKQSKIERFEEILKKVSDSDYKNWLKENIGTFICKPRTQKKAYVQAIENIKEVNLNKVPNIKRGEIYFAKLSLSNKIRPFVILQNNNLNRAVTLNLYHNILVAPISSKLLGGDFRVFLKKRDNLIKDSEIVCNALGLVGVNNFLSIIIYIL